MSGSNRDKQSPHGLIFTVIVAALGVTLYWSMFYSMGFSSGYHEKKAHVEREHYASDTPKQIEGECGTKAGFELRECIADIIKTERESERNESDLAAQWKAADWVLWAGVIAGAQLIATLAGLYYVKRTLDATLEAVEDTGRATVAMEESNEIARDTAQRQLRAYVSVGVMEISGILPNKVRATAHFTNNGETPALALQARLWIAIHPGIDFYPAGLVEHPVTETGSLAVLGKGVPNQITHTADILSGLTSDQIFSGEFVVTAYGWISYVDVFGAKRETRFCHFTSANVKAEGLDAVSAPVGNSMT